LWLEKVFVITITNVNETPAAVALSNQSINENAGINGAVGTFSTTDSDTGQTYTYTLVPGIGAVDNASFTISGITLAANASFDYETKNSYSIRIRTTDNGTGNLWCEAPFTITVNDINETPVDIALDNVLVRENYAGATIGNITVTDQDIGDTHSLTVNDTRFEFVANMLKLKNDVYLNYDIEPVIPLLITATDKGSLSLTKNFHLTVQKDTTSIGLNTPNSFAVTPNPVIGNSGNIVLFTFNTEGIVFAELKIFDAVGNEVYNSPRVSGATGKISWNLINRQGRIVGSGMYVALLQVTDTYGRKRILRTNVGVKQISR
jgi:hypothetical protein